MKLEQIAINSVSTKPAPLGEMLAAYEAAGFRNVEFPLGQIYDYVKEGHSIGDVKALLARHKLRSIGGFLGGVIAFDDKIRDENHKAVIDWMKTIDELGGGILVCGSDGPTEKTVAGLQQLGRTL